MSTFLPALNILSVAAQQDKGKLASGDPWILLADLIWNGQHIRVARNTDPVMFDAGDGLGVQAYQPFNFELTADQNSGGQLPAISLTCSDVLGLLAGLIEEYAGVVGATANIYCVNTAHAAGEDAIAITSIIIRTRAIPRQSMSFDLGAPKPQQQLFPRFLYRADFCMWVSTYKGKWCGYTGTLPNCDGTYNGPDGCTVHDNAERFGAFPGIGTNGASIASQT